MQHTSLGFYIGNFFVAYYGLMIILGISAAAFVGYLQCRRYKLPFDDLILLFAVAALFAVIGAKVLYLIVSFQEIDFSRIFELAYFNALMQGGFVFYGGLFGALGGIVFCKRVFHINIRPYIRTAAPCLPLAHGFGRIGCTLAGCCFGIPYDGWGAIVYESSPFAPQNTPLFPVQATEAVLEFLLFGLLLYYVNHKNGQYAFFYYLIGYSVIRFLLEFLRYDPQRGFFLFLSTSQWISLALFLVVEIWLGRQKRKDRQPLKKENAADADQSISVL